MYNEYTNLDVPGKRLVDGKARPSTYHSMSAKSQDIVSAKEVICSACSVSDRNEIAKA